MADFASGWTPIVELQTGAEVNQKLNNAFTNIDLGLVAITENTNKLALLDPVYLYDKVTNIVISTEIDWYDIGNINMLTNVHAIYEYKMAMQYTLNSTTTSAMFRFSIDNGVTWDEFTSEPKDKSDKHAISYMFPKERTKDQGLQLRIQAKKESAGVVMTVQFADVMIEKKLNIVT